MIINKDLLPTILSIDTSCDETSVAVTKGLVVLSNVVWTQSKVHAKWGGVVPNEAARQHEIKFSWVLKSAVNKAKTTLPKIDAFSVTVGPGLAVALGVGIKNAKELAIKYNKPFIITKENGLMDRIGDIAITVNPRDPADIKQKVLWLCKKENYDAQVAKLQNFNFTHQCIM